MQDNELLLRNYIAAVGRAADLLKTISEYVDDHGEVAPDDVSEWDVEAMEGIALHLMRIVKFIELQRNPEHA